MDQGGLNENWEGLKMCNECKKECIGTTPCQSCAVRKKVRENKFSFGDVLAVISIIIVAYLWAIVGQMITLIRERAKFDVIIEVNKNGTITQVLCDKAGAKLITKLPHKISNTELSVYDRNYYNIVRSNKKKCQEYGGW